MSRIRIELPQEFSFLATIPVRITDVNYGGHVGNDAILSIVHEARMQFLTHYGYTELNCGGVGLIMNDVGIVFKNEVFYGDAITVSIQASEFTKATFEIFYKLEKETGGSKIIIAIAKTGMVSYNYSLKKIAPIPEMVKEKLTQ